MRPLIVVLALLLSFWMTADANAGNRHRDAVLGNQLLVLEWRPVYRPARLVAIPHRGLFGGLRYRLYVVADISQETPSGASQDAMPSQNNRD